MKIFVQQYIHLYMAKTQNQKKIDETYDFIDQWLPVRYTRDVNLVLKKNKKAPDYIRRVKKDRVHNKQIMNALLTVAKFNKLQLEN